MVSIRCKMLLKEALNNMQLHYSKVELGEVEIMENLTALQRDELKKTLLAFGLELLDDKKAVLIEKIKNVIIELIHYSEELPKTNFSDYISAKLNHDYTHMANLFSEAQGITIEHYLIRLKIEKVKELIIYDELTLTEIANKMHYSSVAHLLNQFKKVTGLTPSFFKQLKDKRIPMEKV